MIHPSDIQNVITVVPGSIEKVLFLIYSQLRRQERESAEGNPEGSGERSAFRPADNGDNI
jgi:hypothetical protein